MGFLPNRTPFAPIDFTGLDVADFDPCALEFMANGQASQPQDFDPGPEGSVDHSPLNATTASMTSQAVTGSAQRDRNAKLVIAVDDTFIGCRWLGLIRCFQAFGRAASIRSLRRLSQPSDLTNTSALVIGLPVAAVPEVEGGVAAVAPALADLPKILPRVELSC